MMTAAARVRASLAPNPALQDLFDACCEALAVQGAGVAVTGGLSVSGVDRHSDLDLLVVPAAGRDVETERGALESALAARFRLFSSFDAGHIGLPELQSYFVEVRGVVVKVDAIFSLRPGPLPEGAVVVLDPGGRLDGPTEPDARRLLPAELVRAHVEFGGWTWYVRGRLARGELFEAAHALDAMRRRLVVPVLLHLEGLPQKHYRRLEARLAPAALARLLATHPAELTPAELARALRSLVALFLEAGAEAERDLRAGADQRELRDMLELIFR